jgi:M6 family metalloprotease-like protein
MKERFAAAQGALEVLAFPFRLLAAIFVCSFILSGASAQGNSSLHESERATQVRALNNSVLQLHGQMEENASGAAGIRGLAAMVLAQRTAALQALIQEDPHAALTFAFSPELLADLAAKFPDSSAQLESHTTLSGPIEHWIFDSADMKSSKSQYKLKLGQEVLNLYFAGREPDLAKGGDFQVTGVVVGNDMAVSENGIAHSIAPAAPASSTVSPLFQIATILHEYRWANFVAALCLVFLLAGWVAHVRVPLTRARQLATYAVAAAIIISNPAIASAQGATCSTVGVQKTLVLLVNLPNGSLPTGVTQAAIQDVFFATNTPGDSLDGFLRAASYGQTSASGDVFGPYILTGTYTSCTDVGGAITNDAVAAAIAGGVNLNDYNRVFIVFPDVFGCGWGGFASVGNCTLSTPSGTFSASVAWLSATYILPRSQGVEFASHEMGHNLGLLHSGTIGTGTADVLGPLTSPGAETDQGDYWSTMGEAVLGLYPGPQKAEVLKWMNSTTNYQIVQNSGTYTLQPLETNPPGLQLLKVQRGTGNNEWLWIEYRQPVGTFDATLLGPEAFAGALIHYEDSNTALGHTYLPNFTPSDTTWNSPALAVGQTWTDPYSNVSITVQSATAAGLTVSVSYGATPCTSSAPAVVVSPLNPSIYPGQTASYSVTVTNNDSSGCSANIISLGSSEPAGWTTSLSSPSLTLNPGQSASVSMGKGAPSGTSVGTYAVNLSASNNSASATSTANATVMTPPSLAASVSTNASTFVPPSTASITATVTNGGTPASGASVTFTLTAPNGSASTQSATTSSNGVATWNYKLNQRSPAGTYSVAAQAALSSGSKKAASTQTVSSNTVSFTVQ